ncbi:MAG TPA: GNAT family N-acetyltransferase [Blastocatellia bacterium]|nr:GNAT family N-acetyltransferase [Blastocatellia bacterium]
MTTTIVPLIRLATSDDAALLAELGARTFRDTFASDNKPEDMNAYLAESFGVEIQSVELASSNTTFLIVEVDRIPAGYAHLQAVSSPSCVTGPNPIELARIYVSREWLGRGVGEALMRACIDQSRKAGYETIWLGVWEKNPRAQSFYRKWGFKVVGTHGFQLGSDLQNDFIMERPL